MKKIFFTLALVLSVGLANAQSDSTNAASYNFCLLVGMQKPFSTKIIVTVDFGEERSFFQGNPAIRDEATGKIKSFNSMVDALNFMSQKGWEFIQAYTVTMGSSDVYHWLLRKKK